jgi:hypothetical protein
MNKGEKIEYLHWYFIAFMVQGGVISNMSHSRKRKFENHNDIMTLQEDIMREVTEGKAAVITSISYMGKTAKKVEKEAVS